jgi:hypothetical protein
MILRKAKALTVGNKKIFVGFAALSIIYLLEVLLIPPDAAALTKFRLSVAEIKLLGLTIALPIIIIWLIGAYVYTKFSSYVQAIEKDRDGRAFSQIKLGLFALFLWLPITSITSNITTYSYRMHPSWTIPLVIMNNYLNLLIVLVGFGFVYNGSRGLTRLRETKRPSLWKHAILVPLIVVGGLFIFLSLNNAVRQYPSADVPVAAYYLPDWLLVATIIIPYLLVFYYGFFSVVELYIFRTKVRGVIYKNALDNFAKGLLCIVTSVIFIRYLSALTTVFNSAALKIVLLVIYCLLVVLLLGYILLAKSVKKLEAIEKA